MNKNKFQTLKKIRLNLYSTSIRATAKYRTLLKLLANILRKLKQTRMLEAKDKNARGQGQGPRTQPQVLSKKRSSKNFFRRSPIHRRTKNF